MQELPGVWLSFTALFLVLPLLLPLGVETSSNDGRPRQAASEPVPAACPFGFAEENFVSSVRDSVERLSMEQRPLLVHTRSEAGADSLVFLDEREDKNYTSLLHTPLYCNLKAVSHLPISVVAILAPDLIGTDALQQSSLLSPDTIQALNETLKVLEKARELVTEENFPDPGQVDRQISVIEMSEQFVRTVMDSGSISGDVVESFGSSLTNQLVGNSEDAVRDYLQSLNRTITELLTNGTISSAEFGNLSVIVDIPPFTQTNSFIVQYYEQLLNYRYQAEPQDPNRIVLSPPSPSTNNESDPLNTTRHTFSDSELTHVITRTFNGPNEVFSPPHLLLSQAADEIICSPELTFPSCAEERSGNDREEEELPPGFSNRTERGYVAVIIFISAFCVVLMIIITCIYREGKEMKTERRRNDPLLAQKPKNIQSGNINNGGGSGSEEEDEEEQKITPKRGLFGENMEREPVTARGRFYQNRQQGRRFRGRSSLKEPSTRERPSVTYSEVSIYN